MKTLKLTLLVMFLAWSQHSIAQEKEHKIVFQFTNANDTLQQKAFVKQLENLTEHWPSAQVEVVLYSFGLELMMQGNNKLTPRLNELHKKGVRFVICENSIKSRKLNKDVFIKELVGYVPAGVAEIVEKQEQGWSYIKGGF